MTSRDMTSVDSFRCCKPLKVGSKTYAYYSLSIAEKNGLKGISRLPFSMKVLLENLLRNEDGRSVTKEDLQAVAQWLKTKTSEREIAFRPARVLMQDFTGVPAVVDLAAMRDAVAHRREIDDRRHAGEVLHQHASRTEGELALGRFCLEPFGHRLDVILGHGAPVFVAQHVFQKDFHRERQAGNALEAISLRGRQTEICVCLATNLERLAASKTVEGSHVGFFHIPAGDIGAVSV